MSARKAKTPDERHECPACKQVVPFDPDLNVPRFHMCETPTPYPCACRHSKAIHKQSGACQHNACHCTEFVAK